MIRLQEPTTLLEENLAGMLEAIRGQSGVPGIGVVVEVDGLRTAVTTGVRVAGRAEPLTGGCRFHIGCIAKLLASLVALELARDGSLDLNAPLEEYLTELAGTANGRTVVPVHLLSHTGGYHGTELMEQGTWMLTWSGLVEHLASAPQLFEPGTVFSYEHTGAVLLGEIVRRLTGRDIGDLAREMILEPLEIVPEALGGDQHLEPSQVGQHEPDPQGGFSPIGWSKYHRPEQLPFPEFWRPAFSVHMLSLHELATLGSALAGAFDRGTEPERGISAASRSQLQRPVVAVPPVLGGQLAERGPGAFSLGAARYGSGWLGLGAISPGQCVGLRFHPVYQASIAVGINAPLPSLRDLILEAAAALIAAPDREPQPGFELDLQELAGSYRGSGRRDCAVRVDDERVVCAFGQVGSSNRLTAELVLDDDRRPVVRCALPWMSFGFFRSPGGDVALMAGMVAYRRMTSSVA
ncbi:MAG TPA: serine hydrolase domain-containing protein [Gammaproteobacteria bacterium]